MQIFNYFCSFILCNKNPFENKLNPRSRFQDICVKKGCFREQLKITTSVIALFVVANVSVDA
jgi:hypothetical protein